MKPTLGGSVHGVVLRIRSIVMTNHARPVLVAVADPGVVTIVRQALASMSRQHGLMVITQPAELQQYLQDTLYSRRLPSAIVVNVQDGAAVALVAWMRMQRNAIADIPIVAIGTDPNALYAHDIDAAIGPPRADFLADALHLALQGDEDHVK